MSPVGLPGFDSNRRVIRSPINPLDKSTVVSIYPRDIIEKKVTLEPGTFTVPSGTYEKPGVLVVGTCSWWKDVDPEQPLLEINVSSIVVADSIVKDWAIGLLGCDMGEKHPGLFFLPGEFTSEQIVKNHKDKLDRALTRQKNWYMELVHIADILFARTNGNPISISNDARLAAQELGLKEKPWMQDFTTITMTNCKYCGQMVRPGYPICSVCHHVVDEDLYKKMNPVKVA